MADDWDDWGDDDGEVAVADGGDNSNSSDKSEGWDWPVAATTKPPSPAIAIQQSSQDENAAVEREAREAVVAEMTEKFFVELRSYLENLADPSVREEINQELNKCDFASFTRYYDGRDDLATYTLDTELQRMRYSVVTEDGRRLGGDEREGAEPGLEGGGRGGGGGSVLREFLAGRVGDAMLRMANQSIFADMLEARFRAIQGRLLRPDLEISVISRDCEFFLDFSSGVLEAHSLFEVSTVGGGGPGAPETLEIAHIKGTASVDSRSQTCTQRLLSPQLRMVFDDAMRTSARVLALHSFMDRGAGMDEFGAGVGVGGLSSSSSSLRRIGSLRDSLARASTDGMGRAAAAGTGLLANVVAGVGSAIGASRNGTPAGDFFHVGGGGNSEGPKSTITDEAPLLQLYRRTDLAEEEGRAAPVAAATAGATGDACTTTTTTTVAPDEGTPVINSFYPHGGECTGADGSGVGAGSSRSPPLAGRRVGNGRHASSPAAAAAAGTGGEEATERRSALGMASATGGAVLRGLWGGVQSAAAAGAAVGFAARQGAGAADGGVAEPESPPAFRLYRREGDES
ncbi:unnamed protein product [Ectocarpus sp. CCAP 1310/34]|nr:unnamed protein product [Ectocarpus sp. CCAP 1310/34]